MEVCAASCNGVMVAIRRPLKSRGTFIPLPPGMPLMPFFHFDLHCWKYGYKPLEITVFKFILYTQILLWYYFIVTNIHLKILVVLFIIIFEFNLKDDRRSFNSLISIMISSYKNLSVLCCFIVVYSCIYSDTIKKPWLMAACSLSVLSLNPSLIFQEDYGKHVLHNREQSVVYNRIFSLPSLA